MTYRLTEVDYPAVPIANLQQIFEAYVSAGRAYEFGASVEKGVEDVLGYRNYIHWKCPNTKFALIGYSQGAMVVKDAAKSFESDELGFLLTLGDPETYLPEGEGWFPRACTSSIVDYSLSRWRYYAPECHTFEGLFGGAKPYEPDKFRNKYALMCNKDDFICGSSHNPFRNGGHTAYAGGSLIIDAVHDLVDAKFRTDWVNLLEGLTERPIMGTLSSVEQNCFGMRRVDGDRVLLTWRAPPEADYVLVSLNGVVLGYVEASRGELEIRDLDYRIENAITISYLAADGEVIESESYEPPTIILPLEEAVPDVTPIIIDGPEEIFEEETMSDSPEQPIANDLEPLVADEPESATEDDGPVSTDSLEIPVEEVPVEHDTGSLDASERRTLQDVGSFESQSPQEDSNNAVMPIGSQKASALSVGDNRSALKIVVALVGASAALMLFWFGRRR